MKYTGKITDKVLPKNIKGILIRELQSNLYFRKDIVFLSIYFMRDCNTFEKKSFSIAKKIGILYLSFLSFRLNAKNRMGVEKQSHSPPQNSY